MSFVYLRHTWLSLIDTEPNVSCQGASLEPLQVSSRIINLSFDYSLFVLAGLVSVDALCNGHHLHLYYVDSQHMVAPA